MQNKYPRVIDLINKATKRIPFFISEYLFSGTGNDKVAVANNNIFEDVFLIPKSSTGFCNTSYLYRYINTPLSIYR